MHEVGGARSRDWQLTLPDSVYGRFQRSYLSKLSEDQLYRAIRGAVSVRASGP